jgi:hypothetical protein
VVVFLFLFILLYSFQYTFILPFEVMGTGGSLSTALVAVTYWRDASRRVSWQAVMATVEYSCKQTMTALTFRMGGG